MRIASSALMLAAGLALAFPAGAASAAPRHHGARAASAGHAQAGVRFAARPRRGGGTLVSDGPGTGYGFHRLPGEFRVGAQIYRQRQAARRSFALHQAVETDALTAGSFRSGRLGSDVAASIPYSNYGVFSGADGYGSPYFAGYYGPGGGEDLGPLGNTYD